MPVWHASLSLWDPSGRRLSAPGRLERAATTMLAPVGGDTEWWIWSVRARVAHLRVALTADENEQVPAGCVLADAGETGPPRPETTLTAPTSEGRSDRAAPPAPHPHP